MSLFNMPPARPGSISIFPGLHPPRLPAFAACVLLAVCVLLPAAPGAAGAQATLRAQPVQSLQGKQLVLSARQLWMYAQSLMRTGEYYRAISEYKRLRFFFPQSFLAGQAALRMGEAYLLGGEPTEAIMLADMLLGDTLLTDGTPDPKPPESPFASPPARQAVPLPARLHAPMRFLRGVAWLEKDSLKPYPLRAQHIATALKAFRTLEGTPGQAPQAGDWPGATRVQGFVQAMENPPPLPEKSPWLAAGMSTLLPGLGSLYVGRPAEASLALFSNAVFIYAAVDARRKQRHGLALVLGTAALALYGGNIYAAANGAHKHNDLARSAYLQQQRTRFGLAPRPGGWVGLVEGKF